jgi:hypothetical protein
LTVRGRILATEFNTGSLLSPPTVPEALVRISDNGQTVTTLPVPGVSGHVVCTWFGSV